MHCNNTFYSLYSCTLSNYGFNHKQAHGCIYLQLSLYHWRHRMLVLVHEGIKLIITEIRQTSAESCHWDSLSFKHRHWITQVRLRMPSLKELGFTELFYLNPKIPVIFFTDSRNIPHQTLMFCALAICGYSSCVGCRMQKEPKIGTAFVMCG